MDMFPRMNSVAKLLPMLSSTGTWQVEAHIMKKLARHTSISKSRKRSSVGEVKKRVSGKYQEAV